MFTPFQRLLEQLETRPAPPQFSITVESRSTLPTIGNMPTDTQILRAKIRDVKFMVTLSKKFDWAVGFLPHQAMITRVDQGAVFIAKENAQHAGYLLSAPRLENAKHIRPIFQACVDMDAQRRHHGLALLNEITREARAANQSMLQCFCRQNLEANHFWRAAGFVPIALRDVNAVRGHPCILWRKPLVVMTATTLAHLPPNPRNQTGGGRSVRRHDWSKLPTVIPYSNLDLERELERIGLAA